MKQHLRRFVALLFAVALVAAACGGDDTDTGSSGGGQSGGSTAPGGAAAPTTAAQPQPGGKLNVLIVAETRGMDPITVPGSSGLGGEPPRMYAVYDALMLTDNATGEVKPSLAESLKSDDNIVWTLKLRPNVKFSDGTAYDAEAVKFNWERHGDPANNSSARPLVATIKTMEVVDATTLKVTLNGPNGQFARSVAANLSWTASPTAVKAKGKDYGTSAANIVGAGPFTVKEWTRDSKMLLAKNPTYWRTGQPYLDEIEIRVMSDEQQRLNSLQNNEADVAWLNTLPIQKQATDNKAATIKQVGAIGANGYVLNFQKEPFNDARVRKAIQMAVEPAALNQVATDGLGQPISSWFSKESVWYDAGGEWPKFNIAEAQKLIDAYVAEKGKNVEFTLISSDAPANVKIAEFLVASSNKLQKVSAKVQTMPQAQSTTELRNRNYQMIAYAFLGPDPEPQFYDSWHSKGTRNFTGYNNPQVDAALDRARNTADVAARKKEYAFVQKQLNDDGTPMIIATRTVTAVSWKPKVQGIELAEDGGVLHWDKIWIKK